MIYWTDHDQHSSVIIKSVHKFTVYRMDIPIHNLTLKLMQICLYEGVVYKLFICA